MFNVLIVFRVTFLCRSSGFHRKILITKFFSLVTSGAAVDNVREKSSCFRGLNAAILESPETPFCSYVSFEDTL